MKKRFGRRHLVHLVRDRDVERDFPRRGKRKVPVAVWVALVLGVVVVSVIYLAGSDEGVDLSPKTSGKLICDPNGDRSLNIADAIALGNYVTNGVKLAGNGDCDESGKVNIADAEYLLAYLFGGVQNGQIVYSSSALAQAASAGLPVCTYLFLRGDANHDGSVNIADGIIILNYLFFGVIPDCLNAADVNDDDAVNIADAIYLLNYLFVPGSSSPVAVDPSEFSIPLDVCDGVDNDGDGGVDEDCLSWSNFYPTTASLGDFHAYSVKETFDSNGESTGYVVTGDRFYSIPNPKGGQLTDANVYTVKLTLEGSVEWAYEFGEPYPSWERGRSVHQVFDSFGNPDGYVIAGSIEGIGDDNVLLFKLDNVGMLDLSFGSSNLGYVIYDSDITPNTNGNNDFGQWVEQTNDGGFIISAVTNENIHAGGEFAYLIKTDYDGIDQTLGSPNLFSGAQGYSVDIYNDGSYFTSGYSSLFKTTDSSGTHIDWEINSYGIMREGHILPNNELIVAGHQQIAQSGTDISRINLFSSFNPPQLLDFNTFTSSPVWSRFYSVYPSLDGGFIGAGHTTSNYVTPFLVKTTYGLDEEWSHDDYLPSNIIWGDFQSVVQTSDQGYIAAGSGGADFFVVKTDHLGNI
jgi:hypothetical protein